MAGSYVVPIFFLMVVFVLHTSAGNPDRKVHIVYMGEVPTHEAGDGKEIAAAAHHDMLESVLGSHDAAEKALIYSYGRSFNGFAASLSASEAEVIKNMDGVVSVFENRRMVLHTTRSWDFIGFPLSAKRNVQYESDVIIGMLDTGIWPESKSFKDTGLGPVPSKWKGTCDTTSSNFTCNRKIIGGRFYNKSAIIPDPSTEFFSPRDSNGHGTHTSSTAAGNVVKNASLYGLAQGSARGGVPGSRLAMYKVCWGGNCWDADILAAFDDAINDGVDIISVSLGGPNVNDYFRNSIAIGSFHAMKKGILTSNSAGNDGSLGTVTNSAPWSFTIAASTIDRTFQDNLVLGNNKTILGNAINTYSLEKPWYHLIRGGEAPNISEGFGPEDSRYCWDSSLDRKLVAGKIVVCLEGGEVGAFMAGAEGVVEIYSEELSDTLESSIIPAVSIQSNRTHELRAYMNSTRSPVATILKSSTHKKLPAPIAASFSSRGPSPFTESILKPDITAPGVDILAAWSKAASVTQEIEDKRFVNYNIISGTSMACPHVSGAAAYVKSFHPDWSPAAIKSALMTTASPLDRNYAGNGDKELAYGSGQINPVKAIDPGLVYDANVNSYIDMLCSAGYDTAHLRLVTGDNSTCSGVPRLGVTALNYPSIMVVLKSGQKISTKFPRTLTNVGPARSTYRALVEAPSGVRVTVQPKVLAFTSANQSLAFIVNVEGAPVADGTLISGALTWRYGNYSVRSPIVVSQYISFTP